MRVSEERYRALVEAVSDAVVVVDEGWTILSVNGAAERLFGYAAYEMVGEDLTMLVPEGSELCRDAAFAVGAGKAGGPSARSMARTLRGLRCDGQEVYLQVSWRGFSTGDGRSFVCVFKDATGEDRAEEAGSRYGAVLEATRDFVGTADAEGRVLSLNRAGREIVGAGEDEDLTRTGIGDYHPPWACDVVLEEGFPTALREGAWSGETALLSRDGREMPVWQVIVAHRGADGEVRFLSTVARDITRAKRAEEDLAESRRLFEGIAEATPDLLYVSEFAGGRNVYANGRAEKILGYTRGQLAVLGGAINEELVHPEDRARVLANWAGLADLGDGEVQEHEFRARHADGGYRWLRARNVVLSRAPDGGVRRVLGLAQDVTGDKRAEGERARLLEEAERRAAELDAVIRNMPDAIYIGDATGISVCNDAALEMLGFGSVAELSENIHLLAERLQNRFARTGERIPPEEEPFARALAGETAVEEMIARHLRTGRDVCVRSAAAPIVRGGRVAGAVAVNTDITEQKKAQERLAYHVRLLENMHEAVVATGKDLAVAAWNRGAQEMFGWTAAEAMGRHVGEVIPTEFSAERAAGALRELEEKGRYRAEVASRRKDGTPVYVEGTTIALRDERGRTTGYLSINRDTTERRRAEDALRDSEERYEALASATFEGIAVHDKGVMLETNEALARMFGYEPPEVVGRSALDLAAPESRETVRRNIASGYEGPYEAVGLRKDGTRFPVEIRGRPFEYRGRPVRATAIRDVTERRRAEEALMEIREAERRRIARDLHDAVLQDLASAVQAVQAARGEVQAPVDALGHAADALRRASRGLRGAVQDLRLEEGKPFVRAVESLVELNRQLAPEREVTLEVREGFPPELPDRVGAELLRVVREALVNARRHSRARRVGVTLRPEGDGLRIDVSDDGVGLDPATGRRGDGVGLVGMEERARSLGGELEVRSAPGEGTRVSLRLRMPAEAPSRAP